MKDKRSDFPAVQWLRVCLSVHMGSMSGPGRFHMQLSPRVATTELSALEPVLCDKRSHCTEKPAHTATSK